ncbi:MAG TPA: DUF4294 domain-containing protein [Chitinophagaceae bacterium]|nr:MAG: hypothetical protein UZ11_BCD004000563 [Bacteroidetes bacterium OLB11]HMN31996.1 DUF4294 domain-containing protein [Chitinophagaceae bacterium]
MKKTLLFLFLLFNLKMTFSQQLFPTVQKNNDKDNNQAIYHIELNEAVIVAPQMFANDTDRYHYNQLKYYIKTVMPYVNASSQLFSEINTATANMSKKMRKKYIKSKEKEIKANFEDKLTSLNITQGRLLVKLINRQLNTNCFDIIKDLKNPFTATYYQAWAKLNGINLNEHYQPEDNPDIERAMRSLGY